MNKMFFIYISQGQAWKSWFNGCKQAKGCTEEKWHFCGWEDIHCEV